MRHFIGKLSVALLVGLALVAGAGAQEASGLTPSFGDGRLSVTGDGFKPGEVVTLTMTIDGTSQQRSVTADPRGHFALATGLAVRSGAAVQINAQGNQGTNMAATTAVPGLLLPPTGRSGLALTLMVLLAVAAGSAGLLLRRRGQGFKVRG